jgi:chromate transport protein ChrA
MGNKPKYLFGIPSWLLAILTSIIALIVLIVFAGLLGTISGLDKDVSKGISYLIYGIIITIACLYICRNDPKSIWYVLILVNAAGIISAILEPNFWVTSIWIYISTGWVMSIIGAIIGYLAGVRNCNEIKSV